MYNAKTTKREEITLAKGVLTPDFALIAVLEKDPVEGYAPKNEPKILVIPIAINS